MEPTVTQMQSIDEDIWLTVLSWLPARDVARCAILSKALKCLSRDEFLWSPLLTELWTGKVYIPKSFQVLREQKQCYLAYSQSLQDASRVHIRREELVDFVWSFRFKPSAGRAWIVADPWWLGDQAQTRYFLPNGTVSFHGRETRLLGAEFKWQIIETDDGPHVKIADFPSSKIFRCSNWGFRLESCWVLWTSFPMPLRGQDPTLETVWVSFTPDQERQVLEYNTGFILR